MKLAQECREIVKENFSLRAAQSARYSMIVENHEKGNNHVE
jgi:hypothetical protein